MAIESGSGAYLHTADGRNILDAISSWWVNVHGHCRPEIVAAIQKQVEKLEQVIFAGFTHGPAEQLVESLGSFFPGDSRFFFSDDGSTSVEVALKMAIQYFDNIGEKRHKVLALNGAYHGDTFGAMSVGDRGPFSAPFDRKLFEVGRLPFPSEVGESRFIELLDSKLSEDSEIAAFIFEPLVQGVAGMRTYSESLLTSMIQIAQRCGVLVIADEVMTGFGRTGKMFAFEHSSEVPDLVCLSKGITGGFLPLGLTVASKNLFESFLSKDRKKTFFHGHSYTANPIACAAAVANLQIFKNEPVLNRVRSIEAAHREYLPLLQSRNGLNTRVLGAISAIDFEAGDAGYLSQLGPNLYNAFLDRDVLLRPLGNTIYVLPPYCVDAAEIKRIYDVIQEVIDENRL